jgi:hypothetical protein
MAEAISRGIAAGMQAMSDRQTVNLEAAVTRIVDAVRAALPPPPPPPPPAAPVESALHRAIRLSAGTTTLPENRQIDNPEVIRTPEYWLFLCEAEVPALTMDTLFVRGGPGALTTSITVRLSTLYRHVGITSEELANLVTDFETIARLYVAGTCNTPTWNEKQLFAALETHLVTAHAHIAALDRRTVQVKYGPQAGNNFEKLTTGLNPIHFGPTQRTALQVITKRNYGDRDEDPAKKFRRTENAKQRTGSRACRKCKKQVPYAKSWSDHVKEGCTP